MAIITNCTLRNKKMNRIIRTSISIGIDTSNTGLDSTC